MRRIWILLAAAILIFLASVWYAGIFGNAYLKLLGEGVYQSLEDGDVPAALRTLRIAEILRGDTAVYDQGGRNWYAAIGSYFAEHERYAEATAILEWRRTTLAAGDIFLLALTYLKQDQLDNAIAALNEGIRKYPDTVTLYFLKITALANAGRDTEAKSALAEAIRRFPSNGTFPNLENKLYAQ